MVKKSKRRRIFCPRHDVEMNIFVDNISDNYGYAFRLFAKCPFCSWELSQCYDGIDTDKLMETCIKLGARTFIVKTLPRMPQRWRPGTPDPSIPF